MTSQKDQIQALITEIDGVLQKTTPRLPWVMSGEVAQQRQVLERVRNYLTALQRGMVGPEGYGQPGNRDLLGHDIYYQTASAHHPPAMSPSSDPHEVSAQQMLQMVVQEMGYLRANLMQPLQADLEELRRQREMLAQEIRQLEAQRQGQGFSSQVNQQQLIAEFLQALMGRLQETLPQQMAQMMGSAANQALPYGGDPLLAGTADNYLAQQQVPGGATADQLIVNLDSTLKVVFESLERNVQAYQESLSQGLDRIHGLGQQGEMMFTALINHLAQQLGREASSYLQASGQTLEIGSPVGDQANMGPSGVSVMGSAIAGINSPAAIPAPTDLTSDATTGDATISTNLAEALANLRLPYAGAELPMGDVMTEPTELPTELPASSESAVDVAIDAWLKSASLATNESGMAVPPADNLNLAGFDLANLDLSQVDADNIDVLLELAGVDVPPSAIAPEPALSAPTAASIPQEEDTADIDAALKLLEQLSSELQDDSALGSLETTEAEIDRMLGTPSAGAVSITEADGIPEDARNELDEFYESLFGEDAESGATTATPTGSASAVPVSTHDLEFTVPTSAPEQVPGTDVDTPPVAVTPAPAATASTPDIDPTWGWDVAPEAVLAEPGLVPSGLVEPAFPISLEDSLFGEPVALEAPLALEDRATDVTAAAAFSGNVVADVPELATVELAEEPVASGVTADPPIDQEMADQVSSLNDLFEETDLFEEMVLPDVGAIAANPIPATDPATQELFQQTLSGDGMPTLYNLETVNLDAEPSLADDRYTPASPDEDLLPSESAESESESELWLDENTLSSLSEDLFKLEGGGGPQSAPADTTPVPGDAAATLANWDWDDTSTTDVAEASMAAQPGEANVPSPSEPEAVPVFTLEGMDDLFADLPSVPTVSPVPPPATPTADAVAPFSLEGMGDLFADSPLASANAPVVNPVAPPAATPAVSERSNLSPETSSPEPSFPPAESTTSVVPSESSPTVPFTLEGMDDLFADVPTTAASPPASKGEPTSELTVEQVGDLFVEVPAVPTPTEAGSPSGAFTLEQIGDLFIEAPAPAAPTTPNADVTPDAPGAFTLEQIGDLFMEAPTPAAPATPNVDVTPDAPGAFTLEQIGDLFMEAPTPVTPTVPLADVTPEAPGAFTLEQVGDLFMETPSTPIAPVTDTVPEAPEAFTLEQIGDLFMETPASVSPIADTTPEAAEVFTEETMDDLFGEIPAVASVDSEASDFLGDGQIDDLFADLELPDELDLTANLEDAEALPESFDELSLEQAFESLLGSPTGSPEAEPLTESEPAAPEKKKETS